MWTGHAQAPGLARSCPGWTADPTMGQWRRRRRLGRRQGGGSSPGGYLPAAWLTPVRPGSLPEGFLEFPYEILRAARSHPYRGVGVPRVLLPQRHHVAQAHPRRMRTRTGAGRGLEDLQQPPGGRAGGVLSGLTCGALHWADRLAAHQPVLGTGGAARISPITSSPVTRRTHISSRSTSPVRAKNLSYLLVRS
jgi:hypothetical protein